MAEALAIVGIVSSIIQIVDFSTKILHRIDDLQARAGEVPKAFRHVRTSLPAIVETLKRTTQAIEGGCFQDKTSAAISPAVVGCLEQVQALDTILNKTISTPGDSWIRRGKKTARILHNEAKINGMVGAIQNHVATLSFAGTWNVNINDAGEHKSKICFWLSSLDFVERQRAIAELRQKGSGEWLLSHHNFRSWMMGEGGVNHQTLWCHGQPGSGKTFLASLVVDHVNDHLANQVKTAPAAACVTLAIFLSHDSREAQTVENLMGSLLRQLVSRPGRSIPSYVDEYYNGSRDSRPVLNRILNLLKEDLSNFEKIYLVVDALDECPENGPKGGHANEDINPRAKFLWCLRELMKVPSVKILITSRMLPHFQKEFAWPEIIVRASDHDIGHYIDDKIKSIPRIAAYNVNSLLRERIINNAQGMFLLASLSWASISSQCTLGALRAALDTLPDTLHGMYWKTMERIQTQSPNASEYANAVLSWVSCVLRPLSVDEIRYALAIAMDDGTALNKEWIPDTHDLISFCGGLVMVDEKGTLRLVHLSLQEFFNKERETGRLFRDAQREIARVCLKCLVLDDFALTSEPSEEGMARRVEEVPFLLYAGEYWFRHDYHLSSGGSGSGSCSGSDSNPSPPTMIPQYLSKMFNWDDRRAYLNWLRICQPDISWIGNQFYLRQQDLRPLTFYTSLFDLEELSLSLLARTKEGSDEHRKMQTEMLTGAVRARDVRRVERYLDQGICNGYKDTEGEPLLMRCYNYDVMKLLLDRGAPPNSTNRRGWTPLQEAARNAESTDVVQLLISYGARVLASDGEECALHHAVYLGNPDIVALLLDNGAQRDARNWSDEGPLTHWAAKHGQLRILKLLVANGADLTVLCGAWGSPPRSIIQWFLGEGGHYVVKGIPCGWGMGTEHEDVALFLIEKISAEYVAGDHGRDSTGKTLLHWAASKGCPRVATAALRKGVKPGHRGGSPPMTAKELALSKGHFGVADLLEEAEREKR